MSENTTAPAVEETAIEVPAPVEQAEAPAPEAAPAEVAKPAVELPAWRHIVLDDGKPYTLKERDVLANCVVRDEVTAVISQNWADKRYQLHASPSKCLKVPNKKSKIMSREWMIERLAEESVKQQAGTARDLYFCTRCVIEFRPTPKAAEVAPAEPAMAAEVVAPPAEVEAPAADLAAEAADLAEVAADIAAEQVEEVPVVKPSPAPRRRGARKPAAAKA